MIGLSLMASLPPRLVELIRRDLGASRVDLLDGEASDAPLVHEEALRVVLPKGFVLVVELTDPDADRQALQRRLEVLVESFQESLAEALAAPSRPLAAELLQTELRALASSAGAIDAVVIDAASKVTWGAASANDSLPHVETAVAPVIPLDPIVRRVTPSSFPPPRTITERVVEVVRALPAMAALARGGSLAHHDREAPIPYVARSFATIYVIVMVFDAPFDEIRAERALQARIDGIERLVLALPPIEPTPIAGAKAIRKRR
jgi:hypothetical protein